METPSHAAATEIGDQNRMCPRACCAPDEDLVVR
jgi:hypothetical protein